MRLFLYLVFFLPITLFGQILSDLDGDGIPNNLEDSIFNMKLPSPLDRSTYYNKYIADFPVPIFSFSNKLRVGFQINSTVTKDLDQFITQDKQQGDENETYKKSYSDSYIQNHFSVDAKLGYSFGGIPSASVSIEDKLNIDSKNGIDISQTTKDKLNTLLESKSTNGEKINDIITPNSGYIADEISILNPSSTHTITLSLIRLRLYQNDGELIYITNDKILNLEADQADKSLINQNAVNEVSINPGEEKHFRVFLSGINTNDLHNVINQNPKLFFKVESYEELIKDANFKQSNKSFTTQNEFAALSNSTFKLRIYNGGEKEDEKEDKTYFIARKDSLGNYISLKQALNYIYGSDVSFSTTKIDGNDIKYIHNIFDIISDVSLIQDSPNGFTDQQKKHGFWSKIIKTEPHSKYQGNLDEPIQDNNTEVSFIYVKGESLFSKEGLVGTFETEVVDNSNPISTNLYIKKGDKIKIEIIPYVSQFSQTKPEEITQLDIQQSQTIPSIRETLPLNPSIHVNHVDLKWVFKDMSKQDLIKSNFIFSFGDIQQTFKLNDFQNRFTTFANPNTWVTIFDAPKDVNSEKGSLLNIQSTFDAFEREKNLIKLNEGIIPEDYSFYLGQAKVIDEKYSEAKSNFLKGQGWSFPLGLGIYSFGINPSSNLTNFLNTRPPMLSIYYQKYKLLVKVYQYRKL